MIFSSGLLALTEIIYMIQTQPSFYYIEQGVGAWYGSCGHTMYMKQWRGTGSILIISQWCVYTLVRITTCTIMYAIYVLGMTVVN